MSEAENLQVPLSQLEQAELSAACQKVLTKDGMFLLRRLLWTVNAVPAKRTEVEKADYSSWKPSPHVMRREPAVCYTAGIDFTYPEWFHRIQFHAKSEEEAVALRDRVLSDLQSLGNG